jgi:hypothetical protein
MTYAMLVKASSALVNGTLRRTLQRTSCALASSLERLSLPTCYSTANACYKDAADLHAELEEYTGAISLYDQVANSSLSSALTKYSVKDYWLKALLCTLAIPVSCHLRTIRATCECSTRTT